jgi:hypothetical protein
MALMLVVPAARGLAIVIFGIVFFVPAAFMAVVFAFIAFIFIFLFVVTFAFSLSVSVG